MADQDDLDPAAAAGRVTYGLIGVIAVGLAMGIAELTAAAGQRSGVLHVSSSPLTALGNSFIALTPTWLEQWAIRHFGVHDKDVLLAGMAGTMLVIAVGIGVLARRRPRPAIGVLCATAALTLFATATRPGTHLIDGVPVLAGALAGGWFLLAVRRRVVIARSGKHTVSGKHTGLDPAPGGDSPRPHDRRRFLRFALLGGVVAAAAGALARWIPSAAEVEASRARIIIPVPTDSNGAPPGTPNGGATPSATSSAAASTGPSTAPSASQGPTATPTTTTTPTTPTTSGTAAATAEPPALIRSGGAPSADEFDSVDGMTPFITSNKSFYRVDTTLSPPLITAEDWELRIHGMVAREFTVNYLQLITRPQIERTMTLTCVSNYVGGHLVGNARWIGPRIDALLREASPLPGADCVLSTSVDGFTCSTPLAALTDGRDAMLAVAMNGEPLPIEHGFPVRMVVPGLYGYVSATKWVVDLEITAFSRISAYWTSRGWATDGPVKLSSRIDVPAPSSAFSPGQSVTIAGVAWAQHRGVSAVQIQIDEGAWQPAELAGALSKDTWRQWRYAWKATAGAHVVRCRGIDGSGNVQIGTNHDPQPDGATGYASVSISVH